MSICNNSSVKKHCFSKVFKISKKNKIEGTSSNKGKSRAPNYALADISENTFKTYRDSHITHVGYIVNKYPGLKIKYIGYNGADNREIAIAGTKEPNKVCITNGFGPCVALSLAAVNRSTGMPEVATLHIYTFNDLKYLRNYLTLLKNNNMEVRAALRGGQQFGYKSAHVDAIRQALQAGDVAIEFDEAGEFKPQTGKTESLGVMITPDFGTQFVTHIN